MQFIGEDQKYIGENYEMIQKNKQNLADYQKAIKDI